MNIKRSIALFLLATTPACMATYRVAPAQYVPQNHPDQIAIVDDIGSLHVVEQPKIVNDNLVGIEAGTPDTLSLPVSQVADAVVRKNSPGRTWALVSGLAVGAGLVTAFAITQGKGAACLQGDNYKAATEGVGANVVPCTVTTTAAP